MPTLPNLYGLDVRFRYTEKRIKDEKESKKTKMSSSTRVTGMPINTNGPPTNRHGVKVISMKDYISPTSYK